ncbi:unnamed protein product [Haemonchus placei]|uniref:Bestrophin homolog n=1 Tax=Haemonchus placei TaxID=6290 RepID=A0A0N4WLF0_HAEPC|nr:unnamed protein product [Haemonchus placei]
MVVGLRLKVPLKNVDEKTDRMKDRSLYGEQHLSWVFRAIKPQKGLIRSKIRANIEERLLLPVGCSEAFPERDVVDDSDL